MALVLADRVEQVTRTTGLADLTLAEVIRGRQSFQAVTNNGDTVIYVLEDSQGEAWEIGTGAVVHGTETTLQRTTIRQSSNGGSKISLSAGTHRVLLAADAQYFDSIVTDADVTAAIAAHEAEADPHPQYTTTAEASAAAPVQSVNGETGTVLLDAADVGAAPASHVGTGGAQHADATPSTAGFMSGADKTKLDTVETDAKDDQSAAEVPYSNATSGLTATDVQAALDEIDGQVDTNTSDISTNAGDITTNASNIAQNTSDINERTVYVGSVAELEALTPSSGQVVTLSDDLRYGDFVFKSGDQSAKVTSDPFQGVWVAPSSDATGASGAWMRRFDGITSDAGLKAVWFGVTEGVDSTAELQACIDYGGERTNVYLPDFSFKITDTILLKNGFVKIIGQGYQFSEIIYENVSGGVAFSGDSDKTNSLNTYSYCALKGFSISNGDPTTDPDITVDITSFSYSEFDLQIRNTRSSASLIYGQGNSGASPYYNTIKGIFFGGQGTENYTQTAIDFAPGAWTGGSNGPNANIIGPINRAAALDMVVDLKAGRGNVFSGISAESISRYYIRLNFNDSVETGTSSGSNAQNSFNDTSKSWSTNEFLGDFVKITGGKGSGQVRPVLTNTATSLSLGETWGILPDATSTYAIYERKATGNKFTQCRAEGLASLNPDFCYAAPGADNNETSQLDIQSLGSGLTIRDDSGSARNSWVRESKVVMTEAVENPGPSANIDIYPRSSVFGGQRFAGNYIVEWIKVGSTTSSLGDTATVRLDVGGTSPGGGDVTLEIQLEDGMNQATAYPPADGKEIREGINRGVFVNIQTGSSFSATADLTVTWCVTLV